MGIAKVKVETKPLPIIIKLAPKLPIIFEKIPFLIEVEVWNRTDKAYKDSYLDMGFKPIERPGSIIPVKIIKLGPISSQSKVKRKIWIRSPHTGKFIPVARLYLIEKEIEERDSKVSWIPRRNGKVHAYHAESTVVIEQKDGTVRYYKGTEFRMSSAEINVHSLVELLILAFSCIAAIASLLNLIIKASS